MSVDAAEQFKRYAEEKTAALKARSFRRSVNLGSTGGHIDAGAPGPDDVSVASSSDRADVRAKAQSSSRGLLKAFVSTFKRDNSAKDAASLSSAIRLKKRNGPSSRLVSPLAGREQSRFPLVVVFSLSLLPLFVSPSAATPKALKAAK